MTDTASATASHALALAPEAVANWLEQNPEFFDRHAHVFSWMKVPHPYSGQAISLGERQVVALRERVHVLERQIATLTRTARGNQQTAMRLHEWALGLMAEADASTLPERVRQGLADAFQVPEVALRLWHGNAAYQIPGQALVSEDVKLFAESLARPYCGRDTRFEAVQWLARPPASVALLALRTPGRGQTIGLLVLGAPDETRFTADMGTLFLEQVGELAGAALARLITPSGLS